MRRVAFFAVLLPLLSAAVRPAEARYAAGPNLYRYVDDNPVNQRDPSGLDAEVCCEPTNALGTAIGNGAAVAGIEHCWIRTSTIEAGMGPGPGLDPSSPIGGSTQITDHSGEGNKPGAHCHKVPGCNEGCVTKSLVIGQSTGGWGPNNNCNTLAQSIMAKCDCHNKCLEWKEEWIVSPDYGGTGGVCATKYDKCVRKQIPNLPLF